MIILNFFSDVLELAFWFLLLLAVWKYDAFDKLPYWLQIALYGSAGLSGALGLAYQWL